MTAHRHLRHDGPFLPSSQTARPRPDDVDISGLPALSPLDALAGKHILLLGTTGFLAKIVLALLLERFSVGRIYCAIRGTRSQSPEDRLWNEVLGSEMMKPLRERFGASFEAYVRETVEVVPGDLGREDLGIEGDLLARLKAEVDLVINSAGLVNFNPPLESAVEANALGALRVAELTAKLEKARLVHVSTCYVAGNRSARIREDTPILGYFPKHDEFDGIEFDWRRELQDLRRIIQETKDRTNDAALSATFRQEAIERLKQDGREPNERTLRAATTNQRRRWLADEQIRQGLERARHWGWPNIYTYTKSLGEQAIAATEGLDWAILRPAIVESASQYPFPGWNEGMNTTAPLAYLGLKGQIRFPGSNDLILDVVPVDYVASGIIAAAAALAEGESQKVYQVAAGDVNPVSMARTITLVALYRRRLYKKKEADGTMPRWESQLRQRTGPLPVSRQTYERISTPMVRNLLGRARKVLDTMEPERYGPLSGAVSQAKKQVSETQTKLDRVQDAFDLFMPFTYENKYVFRTNQTRSLFARMNEADRALLPFDTENIDWRHYWLEVHMPGLEKWVFPKLDEDGPKRVPIPRDYRDLAELFRSRTAEHSRRVAYRVVRKGDEVADSYTYRDVHRAARAAAEYLHSLGIGRGQRVLLASEGRPEWGMAYFGIILAGATAVPLDVDLSREELMNIARASGAQTTIASEDLRKKLLALDDDELPIEGEPLFPLPVETFDDVFARAHEVSPDGALVKRKPEDIASIVFTSGTTGRPKGVVLLDRNFASLTARMAALFDLNRTDGLLSVLPPHHTLEFSAGLLLPMAHGASVTYLEDRSPDLIAKAFREAPVTALVGVPVVWESLHRKILNEIGARGPTVLQVVKILIRLNRMFRDRTTWNPARWLLRPIQDAVGGRMRYMVSGAAPLKQDIYRDLRGMGFSIHEGYGLTEAAPVLTVGWPNHKTPAGSVGWPLPGIEVRIADANEDGVGEVIARGPTIMHGYLDDADSTADTLRDGWLHTGDRGKFDDEGRLYIVGRDKDVVIDTSGKNVYPDEIEEIYGDHHLIQELSVVGVPAESGHGERVAALVVPNYESNEATSQDLSREDVREQIRQHFKQVGSRLPFARRVKIMHLWDGELPRTSTRKVRRSLVRDEIVRLENTLNAARGANGTYSSDGIELSVRRTIAAISQRDVKDVLPHHNLADQLGFDSLMQLELYTALEAEFPQARITQDEMNIAEVVGDVVRYAERDRSGDHERLQEVGHEEEARPFQVPKPVASAGKAALGFLQRMGYEQMLDCKIEGQGNIPANRNFIVVANHASHLDLGLVKHALGPFGHGLRTLAARDYFFDDPLRRTYFENFTNLLPIDRHGSLKKSLRLATSALRNGESLLIFPEGTRARDGVMVSFKPAIGHLCLNEGVDILPIFLDGTYESMPVGAALPKARELSAKIGDPLTADRMLRETEGMARSLAYKHVAWTAEQAVRQLGGLEEVTPPPQPVKHARLKRAAVRPENTAAKD